MTHPMPPLAELHAAAKHLTLRNNFKAQGLAVAGSGAVLGLAALLNGVQAWRLLGFMASAAWFAVAGALLWSQVAWKRPRKATLIFGLASLAGLVALALERRYTTNSKLMSGAAVWLFFSPSLIGAFVIVGTHKIDAAGPAPSAAAAGWLEAVVAQLRLKSQTHGFNEIALKLIVPRHAGSTPGRALLIGNLMVLQEFVTPSIRIIERSGIATRVHAAKSSALALTVAGSAIARIAPEAASVIQRWQRDDRNDRDLWLPPLGAQVIGQSAGW